MKRLSSASQDKLKPRQVQVQALYSIPISLPPGARQGLTTLKMARSAVVVAVLLALSAPAVFGQGTSSINDLLNNAALKPFVSAVGVPGRLRRWLGGGCTASCAAAVLRPPLLLPSFRALAARPLPVSRLQSGEVAGGVVGRLWRQQ